ncbi:TetR/AcrR family transcriptional regulator [Spirillospora sp. CA-142024]|uniref:TetR/AcrR family transcriptional regulator n=1 Tax=Spirillospora sp. CA-142024 TaxID=3240036 RepID=UPI003D91EB26
MTESHPPRSPQEPARQRRGERMRQAVLEATVEALLEHGPDEVSIGDVAERAGVHETSVYRRWRTRQNLIVDALLTHSRQVLPIPDTGSVRGDLVGLARALAAFLSTPIGTAFIRTAALTVDDPELAAARATYIASRLDHARVIIERGIARGEIPAATDSRLVLETLVAPLHLQVLLTREPIADDLPQRLADLLMDGLTRN